jgi:hypothetical protein
MISELGSSTPEFQAKHKLPYAKRPAGFLAKLTQSISTCGTVVTSIKKN